MSGEWRRGTAEVEEVLLDPTNQSAESREHDSMVTFGRTSTGKYILVAWDEALDDPRTIRPITAYEVPEPKRRKKRGR